MRITRQARPWIAASLAMVFALVLGAMFLRPTAPVNPAGRSTADAAGAGPHVAGTPRAATTGPVEPGAGGVTAPAPPSPVVPRPDDTGTAPTAPAPSEPAGNAAAAGRQTALAAAGEPGDGLSGEPAPPNVSADGFQLTAGATNPDLVAVVGTVRDFRAALGENPVGNNAEITRALRGENARRAQFLDPNSSTNPRGELLDRWGQPYYFHGISRTEMEVHSAGPDGVMWTGDDQVFR